MTDLPFAADGPAIPIDSVTPGEWTHYAEGLSVQASGFAKALAFSAQPGRWLSVPGADGALERVVFGVSDPPNPWAHGALSAALPEGVYALRAMPPTLTRSAAALAWAMGTYRFTRYKARRAATPVLLAPEGVDMAVLTRTVKAVNLARDLINTPADDMHPAALQTAAEAVAAAHEATVDVVTGDDLLAQNYPLIHAVGRAAVHPPRLVRLTWGDPAHPVLALVGKGVTFDSGGLDIKPPAGMRNMKKDMGGAAHALALADMVMGARLPVRLHVYLAIVENAVAAAAMRPGDIFQSRKGLTVEIDNTDAEGRLILADALTRASEDAPDLILDFATLTGAARVALGPEVPPFFTDDEALAQAIAAASAATADPVWRLPLWMGYDADMDSPVADLKNAGDGGFAGAIYGGLFLKRFVAAKAWAHFDVFAWSSKERPACPQGGAAQAILACMHMLQVRYPAPASYNI